MEQTLFYPSVGLVIMFIGHRKDEIETGYILSKVAKIVMLFCKVKLLKVVSVSIA